MRTTGATVVVRYNGGAQAGHHVVAPDGRRHTFAQLGAGTFVPGVRTVLAAPVVVHPTALLVEARRLAGIGVPDALDRLAVSAGDLGATASLRAKVARLRARALDTLVLTHADLLPRLEDLPLATAHRVPATSGPGAELVADLHGWLAGDPGDLSRRATPVYQRVPARLPAVIAAIEGALGVPVALVSHGPSTADVTPSADLPGDCEMPRAGAVPGAGGRAILPRCPPPIPSSAASPPGTGGASPCGATVPRVPCAATR